MSESGKWPAIVNVFFSLMVKLGPRARVGAAVFPDPVMGACVAGGEVIPVSQGGSQAAAREVGDYEYLAHLLPTGGTPMAATLEALRPRLQSLPGKATYVVLATDGGPNCNPGVACGSALCQPNIESALGCMPGGPNCCTVVGPGSVLDCLDSDATVSAVQALAASNIKVYVVGVPGSAPYASLLDQLAQAGQTARQTEPLYYAVDSADQASLQAGC
jgi:hypothetical protein